MHVSDLADAHVAALNWLAVGKPSDVFNLGNGQGFSVAQVVRVAQEITGLSVPVNVCARRRGDPPTLISDSGKARKLLGWTPKFPELREQISHAFRWFENQSADKHHIYSKGLFPSSIRSVSCD